MTTDVTIVIPTIPPRGELLRRALRSVQAQQTDRATVYPYVVIDQDHEGAWTTRNRGALAAETEWVGFLDDDDFMLSYHVDHLLACAEEHDADVVWGWFEVIGGGDPFPHYRGRQYDPAQPHVVPITYMARTELLHAAMAEMGGFQADSSTGGIWDVQDMPLLNTMHRLSGGRFYASERTTWHWYHHGKNTSGLPTRW